jgi:hypothetical protein
LMTCYEAALPFFQRGVIGDLLFTAVMFGAPVLLRSVAAKLNTPRNPTAA